MNLWRLALLLMVTAGAARADSRFGQCQQEPDPQVRLACYDALARVVTQENPERFALETHPANGDLSLVRTLGDEATFSVACLNAITHLRIRLTQPWPGETVEASVDGVPTSNAWFVRDRGQLLEFGRGLPAINELHRWSGQQALTLRAQNGRTLTVPLAGLDEAVKPLRQQCRW